MTFVNQATASVLARRASIPRASLFCPPRRGQSVPRYAEAPARRASAAGGCPVNLPAAAFRQSDSGQSFVNALRAAGYRLARGDQRGFVVVGWPTTSSPLYASPPPSATGYESGPHAARFRPRRNGRGRDTVDSTSEFRSVRAY